MRKHAIVTGGNRGIGYAVARALVARGLRVVILCRDEGGGRRARDELAAAGPGEVELVVGSLDSVRAVRRAAAALAAACPTVELLIHNAGVWPSRLERNEDGLERAFVVNHLAPFLLNHLLEPQLVAARARVVQVSAGLYVRGRPALDATPTGGDFSAFGTYPTTKLCNLLLVPRFAERWRGSGVTINAVHPGVIRTGLGDRSDWLGGVLRLVKRLWKTPEEGARPVMRLAVDPALEDVTGRYYHLEEETALHPVARNDELAAALWRQACELCGIEPQGTTAAARDEAKAR